MTQDNPRRRHGKQAGKLVECWRKPKSHGFHADYEECPYCDPPVRDYFYSTGPASPGDDDITFDFGWPGG